MSTEWGNCSRSMWKFNLKTFDVEKLSTCRILWVAVFPIPSLAHSSFCDGNRMALTSARMFFFPTALPRTRMNAIQRFFRISMVGSIFFWMISCSVKFWVAVKTFHARVIANTFEISTQVSQTIFQKISRRKQNVQRFSQQLKFFSSDLPTEIVFILKIFRYKLLLAESTLLFFTFLPANYQLIERFLLKYRISCLLDILVFDEMRLKWMFHGYTEDMKWIFRILLETLCYCLLAHWTVHKSRNTKHLKLWCGLLNNCVGCFTRGQISLVHHTECK